MPACVLITEKKKGCGFVWLGCQGGSGKGWGRENHIHNIVYEKLFFSSHC